MKKEICDVCFKELIEYDGYLPCQVYLDGIDENSDEHTSYPTNKSMINTKLIKTTIDTIGYFEGKENCVLYNLNRLREEIYNQLPHYADNTFMLESFQLAWDLWGSDDTLMNELTDDQIKKMALKC